MKPAINPIPDWDPAENYQSGDVVRMPDGTLVILEPVRGEPETPPAWKPLRRVTVKGGARMTRLPGDRAAPEPCPCCYDGATRTSTGVVLGEKCTVCDGTGRRPRHPLGGVIDFTAPLSCGYDPAPDEPRPPITDIVEITITIGGPRPIPVVDLTTPIVYDTEMHPISGDHIGVNPDGTITPFRGPGRLN